MWVRALNSADRVFETSVGDMPAFWMTMAGPGVASAPCCVVLGATAEAGAAVSRPRPRLATCGFRPAPVGI